MRIPFLMIITKIPASNPLTGSTTWLDYDGTSVVRKVWGGNRTWAGARAQAVLMSVWRTCWQQGRSALDFLSSLP